MHVLTTVTKLEKHCSLFPFLLLCIHWELRGELVVTYERNPVVGVTGRILSVQDLSILTQTCYQSANQTLKQNQ